MFAEVSAKTAVGVEGVFKAIGGFFPLPFLPFSYLPLLSRPSLLSLIFRLPYSSHRPLHLCLTRPPPHSDSSPLLNAAEKMPIDSPLSAGAKGGRSGLAGRAGGVDLKSGAGGNSTTDGCAC
jgi:hypothetical protein